MVYFEASKAKVFPLWRFLFLFIHLKKKKKQKQKQTQKKKKSPEIYQISDQAWRATQHFLGEPHNSDHAYTIDIEYNKSTRARILDILIL